MSRLLFLALALSLTMTVLLFSVYAAGTLDRPASAALSNYQCAPQPCWHGIYPATTSIEDAERLIQADSTLTITDRNTDQRFGKLCWDNPSAVQERGCLYRSRNTGTIVASYPESPFRPGPLTFADAVNIFGTPVGIQVCRDMTNEHQLFIALYFRGEVFTSGKPFDLSRLEDRVSFDTPINEIDYQFKPTSRMSVWKGFAPISEIRYC